MKHGTAVSIICSCGRVAVIIQPYTPSTSSCWSRPREGCPSLVVIPLLQRLEIKMTSVTLYLEVSFAVAFTQ